MAAQNEEPVNIPIPQEDTTDKQVIRIYEARLKQASDTIANQGTTITALTILVTVLSIASPLISYFFGVVPSKEAIEKLENDVDAKIAAFIQENQKQQVDSSVSKIARGSPHDVYAAVTFLKTIPDLSLSDEQLFRVLKPLRVKPLDESVKEQVCEFLIKFQQDPVNDFFYDVLSKEKEDLTLINYAIAHLTSYKYNGDLSLLEKSMENRAKKSKIDFFMMMTYTCQSFNKTWILPILNSRSIVDAIADSFDEHNNYRTVQEGIIQRQSMVTNSKISKEEIAKTYLFSKK